MPEVFRLYGFSYYFCSSEHEPVHVHVEGKGGKAKFVWNGKAFDLYESTGLKLSEIRRIQRVIDENAELITTRWYDYFRHSIDERGL